jgi:hypothetical protein
VKTLSGSLWGALLAALVSSASAADLDLDGNRLTISGMLDGTAVKEFESQLVGGQVRTVIFENVMGGSPEVAADYARAILAAGVNTEAKGQCQGACAFAFLAGKEHHFGHGLQVHALLIPLPQKPHPGELASRWQGTGAYRTLAEFTGSPLAAAAPVDPANPAAAAGTLVASTSASTALPNAATAAVPPTTAAAKPKHHWEPNQGVLFTSTPTLFGRVNNSFYCDGSQGRDFSRCDVLPDTDPYKLGILSTP